MNREQSEWNGATDYLNRINQALLLANDAASRLNVYTWLHQLKIFYREISTVMKEEERTMLYDESVNLSEQVNKHLLSKVHHKGLRPSQELISGLELYEIKLRTIYKESGLQMRLQEDASRALR